jgi:hypothetical protein
MFCLKPPKDGSISYYNLNRGSVTDTEMEEMLGKTPVRYQSEIVSRPCCLILKLRF